MSVLESVPIKLQKSIIIILGDKNGKIKDKFPKESRNSNGICHVRPHARNSKDKYFLPMTDKETGINSYTKQSFWFNKSFIFKILKDSE